MTCPDAIVTPGIVPSDVLPSVLLDALAGGLPQRLRSVWEAAVDSVLWWPGGAAGWAAAWVLVGGVVVLAGAVLLAAAVWVLVSLMSVLLYYPRLAVTAVARAGARTAVRAVAYVRARVWAAALGLALSPQTAGGADGTGGMRELPAVAYPWWPGAAVHAAVMPLAIWGYLDAGQVLNAVFASVSMTVWGAAAVVAVRNARAARRAPGDGAHAGRRTP